MNIYDTANKLASEIKSSEEYANYKMDEACFNAFGKEIEWDGIEKIVYIGKKNATEPDNYLDKIQYNDYKTGNKYNKFSIVNGKISDYNDCVYKNGILFYRHGGENIEGDEDACDMILSYPLNSQYKMLKGKVVLPKAYSISSWGEKDDLKTSLTSIYFYGDGKLLYKANSVINSMPHNFDINVNGVNQLSIKVITPDDWESDFSYLALTDLALYE